MTGVSTESVRQVVRVGPIPVQMDDITALKEFAARDDSSVSREIRRAIRLYIDSRRRRDAQQHPTPAP